MKNVKIGDVIYLKYNSKKCIINRIWTEVSPDPNFIINPYKHITYEIYCIQEKVKYYIHLDSLEKEYLTHNELRKNKLKLI